MDSDAKALYNEVVTFTHLDSPSPLQEARGSPSNEASQWTGGHSQADLQNQTWRRKAGESCCQKRLKQQ